ncbi:hypothetical protein D3P96_05285 [Weissella viridescens]|uniref:Uncharacterized protein n=1 Tax=Weissella viridescens TaxID=1629 RepID=A0A3P2RJC0_WEIVI|nr:hypothetical protein [Weissella viridescens]RRG17812.1 hypothetical protein D3P96_05285 [Weissella viridescens]
MPIQNMIGILTVVIVFIAALIIIRMAVTALTPLFKGVVNFIMKNMSQEMRMTLRNHEDVLEEVLDWKIK